jgi:hypothetical protein
MDNNSDNDSFGSFLSKKKNTNRIFCSIKQIIYDNNFGYEKMTIVVDNMPLKYL